MTTLTNHQCNQLICSRLRSASWSFLNKIYLTKIFLSLKVEFDYECVSNQLSTTAKINELMYFPMVFLMKVNEKFIHGRLSNWWNCSCIRIVNVAITCSIHYSHAEKARITSARTPIDEKWSDKSTRRIVEDIESTYWNAQKKNRFVENDGGFWIHSIRLHRIIPWRCLGPSPLSPHPEASISVS